ncbi:hypothetical protein PDESU_03373 [Pontiella desulfatans]|uniref:Glycosyl transferase family 1 domain-containing protein n=2 Tax=Pontiella desulfatans TaxID=2750659 RepID=A0A6C2U5V3_PONDE|nr:hypothetical protein PDESU_03373 [Pontiella desulfatans]
MERLKDCRGAGDVRIHFMANPATNDDLADLRKLPWEKGTVACTAHTWVWAIYRQLKDRGFNVSLGYEPDASAINVVHCQVARRLFEKKDFSKYFLIGIRADFRPFPYGHFEIVQNRHSEGGRRIFMPLYSQPGLIPRDLSRKKIENICFSGRLQNSTDLAWLEEELEKIGCRFVFKGVGQWQEMSDVDILLGIRTFSKEPHHTKPATKLYNAWLAGIPFVGGYDSAYEQIGVPDKDYLRVASGRELVDAIKNLAGDPALFMKMVENGWRKGQEYQPERITDQWIDFFERMAAPAFRKWRQRPSWGWRLRCLILGQRFAFRERFVAWLLVLLGVRRGACGNQG